MNIDYQKRLAAKIMKCGVSRIRVEPSKEVGEALTRDDVRNLIKKGLIRKIEKRGASRGNARLIQKQKKKGLRQGRGSKKGTRGARSPAKKNWIMTVRALRRLLKELRDTNKISNVAYKDLYKKVKGGYFRNKNHLLFYMKDSGILKRKG